MSLMSPLREHTHKHSLKREQIGEQEEDHFQKRVARISMQRWARKSRQIPAFITAITNLYSTDFLHRNRGEICTEIEAYDGNRGSCTAFIESVWLYGSIQPAQKSRSIQYSTDPYSVRNF
jgi:hypothetical protein